MKILLTGSKGQLGLCFQDRLPQGWDCLALDSTALDISSREAVLTVVREYQPDAIVNAAAYTAVDKAEGDAIRANAVNAHGPENLASAANEVQARLVHISTDYVFDGSADVPYLESDAVNPLGVYGKSKLAGELLAQLVHPQAIIIRTAWVFSEYGNNFLKTMLRLGQDRDTLGVVADQYGNPTYAGDIAEAVIELLKAESSKGIYHYCGDAATSWHQFAEEIFRQAVEQNKLACAPVVNAITTDQYPTPAARPAFSTLCTEKIQQLGIQPSDWQSAITKVLGRL
ncbi:dTDP-4-dehydrorhamnose reductase [Erwinia sp. B116]|uniref:dTDP-4-dehydrorhamnose reductase n=1 Tax=Erwinia sp. B116 TaxID=1561024 RepID=UPI000C75C388|nr:dTDP-4-dehydrorhamnose reductase [Erwinia sp. B116]PLV57863.1 dTDP-4-dehydrorhamnose reductase [Erwinia sp. B116]